MLIKELREEVLEANLEIVRRGLVLYTFGNVSGFDRDKRLVAIKPSGVPFEKLTAEDMVVCDLACKVVEGSLKPSSDLDTHVELYKNFRGIGGVVHTHSTHAVAWAQAGYSIPCLGTTHADYFNGPIPVTDPLEHEDFADYERNTGAAIIRAFENLNPRETPGVLVRSHGPFVWGPNPTNAAMNAVLLEEIARAAIYTLQINPGVVSIGTDLLNTHFQRKHGPKASYGQG